MQGLVVSVQRPQACAGGVRDQAGPAHVPRDVWVSAPPQQSQRSPMGHAVRIAGAGGGGGDGGYRLMQG